MSENKFMKVSLANKSVVERIVDQITNAIINGELKPGDKIPTEPELCETFNVGRNSVREAIKILEAYGVVEIRRADGTYIRQEYNYKMLYPILYGIILKKDSKQQLIELRKVIDLGILQEAMKQIIFHNIYKHRMKSDISFKYFYRRWLFLLNFFFHISYLYFKLFKFLVTHLLDSIAYYVDKITRQTRVLTIDYMLERGHREEFVTLHRDMLDMLRNKREDQIPEIVERHYQYWEK